MTTDRGHDEQLSVRIKAPVRVRRGSLRLRASRQPQAENAPCRRVTGLKHRPEEFPDEKLQGCFRDPDFLPFVLSIAFAGFRWYQGVGPLSEGLGSRKNSDARR